MSTALSAPQQQSAAPIPEGPGPDAGPHMGSNMGQDWKRQLAERLDAYRAKRPDAVFAPLAPQQTAHDDSRASKIARSVASRYAAAPSYSELIEAAARAEREALEAAEHAAHLAAQAREQAAREEQRRLDAVRAEKPLEAPAEIPSGRDQATTVPAQPAALRPGTAVLPRFAARSSEMRVDRQAPEPEPTLEDLWASSVVEPRELLPAKLIEFPRELVSNHRARPRLPEIPAEAPPATEDPAQLRIFEVHPEQAAAASAVPQNPAPALGQPAPGHVPARTDPPARPFKSLEWAAISLDKEPARRREPALAPQRERTPFLADAAAIDRRVMAFAVDFSLVGAGFLSFLLVFAACTPHLPAGIAAAALAGVVYGSLWLLYQMLFFSLSGATAGMHYARIALCTFDDRNPTRSAMRRRLAAWWLSCLPLGLGCFWCFVDEDNLSWHDRITRTYQRSY